MEGGSRAFPCMAVNRRKKTVSFAEQPMIVLVTGTTLDEYTFGNGKVSQTVTKRRKTRRGRGCSIEAEIKAHAWATDWLLGIHLECGLPEPHTIQFVGRRPLWRPASFWGDDYWED